MDAAPAQQRRDRRDDLLRRAVDFALRAESRVDLAIIAGDLFDSHQPDGHLVGRVLAELRRLETAGIPVVTVPGNHDEITYFNTVYRQYGDRWPGVLITFPHPAHVATLQVAGQTVHVYGLAYTGGITRTRPPIAEFPRVPDDGVHVAVFHGSLRDWGGDRSLPLDGAALARAGYDYVALGHIHLPQEHRLGSTLAVYPGLVEGKGFDDPGCGQLAVAEVGPGQARLRREPIAVQPVRTVPLDCGDFDDAAALEAAVQAMADPEAITRVRLRGARGFFLDPDALRGSLAGGFFHLEVADDSETVTPALLAQWAAEPTVLGQFVRRLRDRLDACDDGPERLRLQRALGRGVHALRGSKP